MQASILDTNVLVIANRRHDEDIRTAICCTNVLENTRNGLIVLDKGRLIIDDYIKNVHESGQPGAGDAFLKWLFTAMWVLERCEQVPITEHPVRVF